MYVYYIVHDYMYCMYCIVPAVLEKKTRVFFIYMCFIVGYTRTHVHVHESFPLDCTDNFIIQFLPFMYVVRHVNHSEEVSLTEDVVADYNRKRDKPMGYNMHIE